MHCSMNIQVNKREECHKRKHHRTVKHNDPKHSFYSTCISHFTGSTIPFPIQSRSYLPHSGTRLEPRSLNLQSNFHSTIPLCFSFESKCQSSQSYTQPVRIQTVLLTLHHNGLTYLKCSINVE